MSGPKGIVPERLILELLRTGIEVIVADLASAQPGESVLDNILANLDAAERARHREWFATNPPSTLMGYPRIDGPFPVIALTLAGDTVDHDYLGVGEHVADGVEQRHRWVRGSYALLIYGQHPDMLAMLYRVVRRILNVGIPWLIARGMYDLTLDGMDLNPSPEYPENLFVRRITLAANYHEAWATDDALHEALYGPAEAQYDESTSIQPHIALIGED